MANVSQYLQAPGTVAQDVHEKALSKKDLKETFTQENERSALFAMAGTLGIGVSLGDVFPAILINSQWSAKEAAVRLGIATVSLVATYASINFLKAHKAHADRAFELLNDEIGDRPVEQYAANPVHYPQ